MDADAGGKKTVYLIALRIHFPRMLRTMGMLTLYRIFGSTLCSQNNVTLDPFSIYFLTTRRASISEYPSRKRKYGRKNQRKKKNKPNEFIEAVHAFLHGEYLLIFEHFRYTFRFH